MVETNGIFERRVSHSEAISGNPCFGAPSVPPNRWAPTSPAEIVGAAQSLPMVGGSVRAAN